MDGGFFLIVWWGGGFEYPVPLVDEEGLGRGVQLGVHFAL